MSDDNIRALPPIEADKLRAAVENLKRNMETNIEFYGLVAKLTRAKYEAYVSAGFSPSEALFLVREAK